jgi:hypothetical protein
MQWINMRICFYGYEKNKIKRAKNIILIVLLVLPSLRWFLVGPPKDAYTLFILKKVKSAFQNTIKK